MAAEDHRNEGPIARSRRVYEGRRLNYQEAAPPYAVTLFATGAADTTDEAGAAWGDPIACDHYERIMLDLAWTQGAGDVTTVHIAAQAATIPGAQADQWFDVYRDEAGDGVLERWVHTLAVAADAQVAWMDLRRVSRYMRFKVWTSGGTSVRTGTRATLRGQRVMDAA